MILDPPFDCGVWKKFAKKLKFFRPKLGFEWKNSNRIEEKEDEKR